MLTSFPRAARPIEPVEFRRVLGHYPAGVVAVTAAGADRRPAGMVVSSFTSVSLEPPLVAFLPAKSSSTFASIREAGRFCVNVLGSQQEDICRQLAVKGGDKFANVDWFASPGGSPIIEGAVAWIDCSIDRVHDAGDHWIVIGRVSELSVTNPEVPLLFYQGGYGRFLPLSISAVGAPDLVEQLQVADALRPGMAALSRSLGVEVLATARLEEELVTIATSGHPDPRRPPTRIGQRMPYLPPLGVLFAAWDDVEGWVARGGFEPTEADRLRGQAERVRERGWSSLVGEAGTRDVERALRRMSTYRPTAEQRRAVAESIGPVASAFEAPEVGPEDSPAVRTVAVPVFARDGSVRLALTAYGLPAVTAGADLHRMIDRLRSFAESIEFPADRASAVRVNGEAS